MFNSLSGMITEKTGDSVYLLIGGVEWDISVPYMDMGELPAKGKEGKVFTWLYHREDQVKLYGFSSVERRNTFLELLKVDGIGPKGAVKILGGIGQRELEAALENEDLSRLESIPGLGKKTAQKMILALKGKLVSHSEKTETPYTDLLDALTGMGYDKKAALEALNNAEMELPPDTSKEEKEKQLFKQAIIFLSNS